MKGSLVDHVLCYPCGLFVSPGSYTPRLSELFVRIAELRLTICHI
jgi:hypothetical protein